MKKEPLGSKTLGEFLAPYREAAGKRHSLYDRNPVFWTEMVAIPLAKALGKYIQAKVEFRGPFGLKCRFSLETEGRNGVELIWMGAEQGIGQTDYSQSTHEYPMGSIGYWNGFNYPDIPLPERTTVADLADMILHGGTFKKTLKTGSQSP